MDTNYFGKKSEELAQKFLKKHGLKILETNFHSRFGEIDIIAQDKNIVHFIEVKSTCKNYDVLYRITKSKYEKMIKTMNYYFMKNDINFDFQIDAILINNEKIEWIKNINY